MKIFFVLLLLSHVGSTVKYTLKFLNTGSSGLPDFPEFVSTVMIDEVQFGHCDSDTKTANLTQDLAKEFLKDHPEHLESYSQDCLNWPQTFRTQIDRLKKALNQSEDAHILQNFHGCAWDDETGETDVFDRFGYDGEDLFTLDPKTMTWIFSGLHWSPVKLRWTTDKANLQQRTQSFISSCTSFQEKYVHYGGSFLKRTDLPSVSLLQKSPSSPVTCFATGFYPDRAVLFWRKDGEEIHDILDHRDILPNHDGSFQMSVTLNISLVKTEDLGRYECVFQLSGVKEDLVTKLEKVAIRSNNKVPGSGFPSGFVTGVTVVLLLSVCVAGLFFWRKNNNGLQLTNIFRCQQRAPDVEEDELL